MPSSTKPALAVWKFASCDGCQLQILSLDEVLLDLTEVVEVAYFLEASSATTEGPYDISLVEGSITTPEDEERIAEIRRASRTLITIGACATAGGIQALRNFADVDEFASRVYASPEQLSVLATSTPIDEHVEVEYALQGCPVNGAQVVEVITALLHGRRPNIPSYSVCVECKRRGIECVMVAGGTPCLGPVTHAGCGALCPSFGRGCYGCFGQAETTTTASLARWWTTVLGVEEAGLVRALRTYNAAAPAFAEESSAHVAPRT